MKNWKTIYWENDCCKIIDQTLLPEAYQIMAVEDVEQMIEAIKMLRVRGAPAIGVAAAYGMYLGVRNSNVKTPGAFMEELKDAGKRLGASRPTAVNLFWAIDRIINFVKTLERLPVSKIKKQILEEAIRIDEEDVSSCRAIGENGAPLLKDGCTVLTHCNAGALATADYGTALSPVYVAAEQGKEIKVFADETRPLLQGSRLTVWELMQSGIDVTLICDNMAASVMAKGWIDMVIVGADRVAANGDFANKIGTYGVAVLAKEHEIPLYVAAPFSTIDFSISSGKEIPIEERGAEEVACGFGKRTAPAGAKIYNPAFDVTPVEMVKGFITEKGVLTPPFPKP